MTTATGSLEAREALLARLSRIEGQVRGVRRMVEDGRACAEVLPQLRSVIQALCRVQDLTLQQHLHRCIRESFAAAGADERERKAEEVFLLLSRYREP